MLGHTYRLRWVNDTNANITASLTWRPWGFAAGAKVDGGEVTLFSSVSVSVASSSASSTVDNSSSVRIGAHGTYYLAPASAATGWMHLYLEHSTDGGANWPTAGSGRLLRSVYFAASSATVIDNVEAV